jgi:hypothetical protein
LTIIVLSLSVRAEDADSIDASTYPRTWTSTDGTVLIHHPVIDDWQAFETLAGRTPVEVTLAGADRTWVGSAAFEVGTEILGEHGLVRLIDPSVRDMRFEDGAPADRLAPLVRNALAAGADTVVLDFLVRALPEDFEAPGLVGPRPHLNFDPPRIVVANRPTRLLLIDGPPAMSPIRETSLEIVVNSVWEIYHDKGSDRWYLLDDESWLGNTMLSGGEWTILDALPQDLLNLQYATDWAHLQSVMPPRRPETRPLPFVISYEPAELVIVDGPERFEPIPGTDIEVLANSANDLFRLERRFYLLLAGRWFQALDIRKNWQAVRDLPGEFARIPRNHPRARVLASVPGTPEARVAAIEAAIPRTVEQQLGEQSDVVVPYVGEPSFVPIQTTTLLRAENTPYQVIRHNNYYYLCHEGAWYFSDQPDRGFEFAPEIPEAIYAIPPTDPAYNVTFVRVDSFDDSSGRVAYSHTQGYRGTYWSGSSVVYGTGWYYPPYVHPYRFGYPYYWRHPYAWGYGAWYDPFWGGYYPVNRSWTFDKPDTDKDWEWGLDGSKKQIAVGAGRSPTRVGAGGYYGSSRSAAPGEVRSELASENNGSDDLYSGSDGMVYRRTPRGWQRREDGRWVTLGDSSQAYLERQYQARETGYRQYEVQRQWDYPGDN